MNINGYELDEEASKEQYENVDVFFASMAETYTISQLRALADGMDKIASIQDWQKYYNDPNHRNTVVFKELKYGFDAYCIASNLSGIIDIYSSMNDGEPEHTKKAKYAQVAAKIINIFGTVVSWNEFTACLSDTLTYGSLCLENGAKIIENRLTLLDEYDAVLDEILSGDENVEIFNSKIEGTTEEINELRNQISLLTSARTDFEKCNINVESLDNAINIAQMRLDSLTKKSDEIIQTANKLTGKNATNLSDVANDIIEIRNNSTGEDWTDTTTDETTEDSDEGLTESDETPAPRDPLVIDLGKKGIELTGLENGVHFDLDKNGFAEKTAWIGEEDGFLAYDRNNNGIIDNGGELFSDQVVMSDGSISTSGFAALSDLDSNSDGVIDEKRTIQQRRKKPC